MLRGQQEAAGRAVGRMRLDRRFDIKRPDAERRTADEFGTPRIVHRVRFFGGQIGFKRRYGDNFHM